MPKSESSKNQQPDFEHALGRLKEINQRFEKGDLSLEEAIRLYQEGVQLTKTCEEQLAVAEQTVRKVIEEATGKISEQEFKPSEG
jgi:exodeoxyribonuclease VII small subunit